jgi:hypothetical protein
MTKADIRLRAIITSAKGIRRFCFGSKLRARDYQSPFRLWAVSQKSSFQSVTLAFMLPMRFKNAAK